MTKTVPFLVAFISTLATLYVTNPTPGNEATPREPASKTPSFNNHAQPSSNACFSVYPNGQFTNDSASVVRSCVASWDSLDAMIFELGQKVYGENELEDVSQLKGANGAKLYTGDGLRVFSLLEISQEDELYVIPQGQHFMWPLKHVGNIITPKSVTSPVQGKTIELRQMTESPRVFKVTNFVTKEEIKELLDYNQQRVKPSEVGFSGRTGNRDRTSSTGWDGNTQAAKDISRRSFEVLGWDFQPHMQDTLQILNYKKEQWYKPHLDAFNGDAYDNYDPSVNNGTNRIATVFIYLSDVEKGGDTVFPLSTTHEGYNGEKIVHDGTVNTPGYIDNKEAMFACNYTSSALRVKPVAGDAVIFYSQLPDGALDPYSLHGGCPPVEGEKWSANVWIWNRPKPSKSEAKDKDKGNESGKPAGSIAVRFDNDLGVAVESFWVSPEGETVSYGMIQPGSPLNMNTYVGHTFRFTTTDGVVRQWTADNGTKDNETISLQGL